MGIKQTTKRFLSLISTFVFIISAFIIYLNFIRPATEEAQSIKAEFLSQEAFLESQTAAIEQVENLIREYKGEGKLQDVISMALPLKPELSSVLAQTNGLIRNNGLALSSVNFAVSGNENLTEGLESRGLAKPIGSVRIQASFSGTYEDVKRLLENFETNIRIIDVLNFSLTPPGRAGADERSAVRDYNYSVTAVTYYQVQ